MKLQKGGAIKNLPSKMISNEYIPTRSCSSGNADLLCQHWNGYWSISGNQWWQGIFDKEYFVTSIMTYAPAMSGGYYYQYTLKYTTNGTTWEVIPGADNIYSYIPSAYYISYDTIVVNKKISGVRMEIYRSAATGNGMKMVISTPEITS